MRLTTPLRTNHSLKGKSPADGVSSRVLNPDYPEFLKNNGYTLDPPYLREITDLNRRGHYWMTVMQADLWQASLIVTINWTDMEHPGCGLSLYIWGESSGIPLEQADKCLRERFAGNAEELRFVGPISEPFFSNPPEDLPT